MPSVDQLRNRLLGKLSELFQLDQPDLDFGFYRIMHAKAQEVQNFIGTDLLKIVADAFGEADDARKAELQAAYEKAIQTAKDFGASNPEETEPVKKAKAALDALKDTAGAEADVYDHLYRFFERYYDAGDFISRRYYTRETSGKAAPYAIPYNGEEVKLVWANMDQYYIKSAEYFSNFTFDLQQALEIRALRQQNKIGMLLGDEDDSPLKVHFKIVDATEGEHGNVKASEQNKRFFMIHKERAVALNEAGELVVHFEYRPDPEKGGTQESTWRDRRNAEAVETILKELESGIQKLEGGKAAFDIQTPDTSILDALKEYLHLFKIPAPTDSDKKRPLLAKYINQYTARNTMDYFIHKDLGGFLRRELDFYIKNEVMRLDDIENADAPAVESYLSRIKVLRKIAGKLIDFLASLEDFQKKLWLKKKFIIETNYCITLDRICNDQSTINNEQNKSKSINIEHYSLTTEQKWLLQQVVENKAQWAEWQKLGFVQLTINNEQLTEDAVLEAEDFVISFNGEKPEEGLLAQEPLTYRKLIDDCSLIIAHWNLVLDTRFFGDTFKARLLASIENFDEQCDGLLIHSENFQALNLLQERYREQVKCIYIDPPYNANSSEILYKNTYKHSSWLSLMADRLMLGKKFFGENCSQVIAIDEVEQEVLGQVISYVFVDWVKACVPIMHNPRGQQGKNISYVHEFAYFIYPTDKNKCISDVKRTEIDSRNLRDSGTESDRTDAKTCFYPFLVRDLEIIGIGDIPPDDFHPVSSNVYRSDGTIEIWPIDESGQEKKWRYSVTSVDRIREKLEIKPGRSSLQVIFNKDTGTMRSLWMDAKYDASEYGTKVLQSILGINGAAGFSYPKSINTVKETLIAQFNGSDTGYVLDYFAGSGTTGHAVINLNREDNGKRKYILVEMGDYFDTVLKPRIAKVVYAKDWKDGKPTARDTGISHCFKYIRLESYEDTLNNLRFNDDPRRKKAVSANPSLKEDYMLHYLLDVETRGSQSLLNIDAFADTTAYTLEVKKPGTDEYAARSVDLIETFNYLIGLRVVHTAAPQEFTANFKRFKDPELPEDQHTRLVVDGRIRRVNDQSTMSNEQNDNGSLSTDHCTWWFRKVEGWVPKDPMNPNDGQREKVLIVWRKLTGDIEKDNLMLDKWFQSMRISTRDFEFDTVYVNGSNNLPNLKLDGENWKVRLIEEAFMKRMWDVEGV